VSRITYYAVRNTQYALRNTPAFLIITLLTIPILFACMGRDVSTPYVPPTPAATSPLAGMTKQQVTGLPTEDVDIIEAQSSPTPACVPNLTFLEDLTIPDGTLVAPGAALDKRWQVENSGTCNWDQSYRVKLLSGPDMGAVPEQALYPALSGTEAVIRIKFTVPEEAGVYQSAWQAHDPEDEPFGDPFFIEIIIE
jgi:hypothetical protein